MTDFFSLMAIAVGVSADAFAVTVSNMLCYPTISARQKSAMPLLFGLFQGLMPLLGYFLGAVLQDYISAFDHWVALALLTVLGVKMITETVSENKKNRVDTSTVACENSAAKTLSAKTLLVQAVATSIDALTVGVTLAVGVKINVYVSVAVIALVTTVICSVGLLFAKVGKSLKNKAGIIGGIILILIGLKIFIEHLIG